MRWALVLAAVLGPSIARADGVGVLVLDGDRAAGDAMVRAIGTDRGRVTREPIADAKAALAAGAVPIATMAKFKAVREQIAEGWRAYLQVSVDFAASRLASARTEAESLIPLPGGVELYADASLRLGAVLSHLGRTDESRAVLRLALALDPDRAVTTAEFSPDVVEAIGAARLVRPPSQHVRIAADPSDAEISVDGLALGTGTRELDLARGQHVIVARAPGRIPLAQAVAVDEVHTAFTLRLDEDPATAILAGETELAPLVDLVIQFAELDELVIVEPIAGKAGSPALVVQRCVGLPARCSAGVELGHPDSADGIIAAAREGWAAVRVGELRYPPARRGEARGPATAHRAFYRNPWVLGGTAAAVVVAAVVIYFAATASTPNPVIGVDPGMFVR